MNKQHNIIPTSAVTFKLISFFNDIKNLSICDWDLYYKQIDRAMTGSLKI